MKVEVNKLPKGRVELIIEVSPDELRPYMEEAARELSSGADIPGFRPGKAPYKILEKHLGAMEISQQTAEKAVRKTYPRAVADNKLLTIGPPKISLEKIAPDNPLVYKATVSLLPTIEIGDYKKVKADKKPVSVEQGDIDKTIDNLRQMFGKENRVQRPVQKDDKVEVDMNTYVDKVPIDGGEAKKQALKIGEGHFVPGFEDNVIGMEEGQTKEFQLKFPKKYHRQDLANRPVEFKVKVISIFEIELPPLDDGFAAMVGRFNTLDDLKDQISKNIKREKEMKERQRWEMAIMEKIIKGSKFGEIADNLTDSELNKMMRELEYDVKQQGMKFDDYLKSIKKTPDDLKKEFYPKAEQRIKTALVLREIALSESLEVAPAELELEIEKNKQQHQNDPKMLKQVNTDEYKEYVSNMMSGQKVFEFLDRE